MSKSLQQFAASNIALNSWWRFSRFIPRFIKTTNTRTKRKPKASEPTQGGFRDFRVFIYETTSEQHCYSLSTSSFHPEDDYHISLQRHNTFNLFCIYFFFCYKNALKRLWTFSSQCHRGLLFFPSSDSNSMFEFVYRLGVAYERDKAVIIKRTSLLN